MKRKSASCLILFSTGLLLALLGVEVYPGASALAAVRIENPGMSAPSQPESGEHGAQGQGFLPQRTLDAVDTQVSWATNVSGNGFTANWTSVSGAAGYRLDVSTSSSFSSCVGEYQDLDVGNVLSLSVNGLSAGTTYYYRVRPYYGDGTTGSNANVVTVPAATNAGLIINATFDSSITSNPNSAAIQSMVNQAIAVYQSLYADQITVNILFRYSSTLPNGNPIPAGNIARSNFIFYPITWDNFINALKADAKTANDATATSSLPASALSTNIKVNSANGRALGLNTPPGMCADSSINSSCTFDGIVTVNSSQPFQFARPPSGSAYDAQRSTEHEIDEVLGMGSYLNGTGSDLRPQDLFNWSAPNTRNLTTTGSRYFSLNSGNTNIVGFNQDTTGDFGDWLSASCPQANPYVQNAFSCTGQVSDVTSTSPEGINLDVIGYDLVGPLSAPTANGGTNITSSSFTANWSSVTGANGYRLDVSTNSSFSSYVGGYQNLDMGNVTSKSVSGLSASTTYYYRVRAYNNAGTSGNSNVINLTTTGTTSTPTPTPTATPTPPATPTPGSAAQVQNISTRAAVGTGGSVLIGGFIIQGNGLKRVIVRAIGPSLANFGVVGALADTTLELHDGSGNSIAFNDDWTIGSQAQAIRDTGLAPTDSRESALIEMLAPGNYTAIVRGYNGMTGIALVEVYDLDQGASSQLANISTRGYVNTGDYAMIGGFIVGAKATFVIRGIGPSLSSFGVSDALLDPVLYLYDSQGTLFDTNDDWRNNPYAQLVINSGLAPTDDRESALIYQFFPGNYTAIIRGYNGTTGIALVEVYNVK